MLNCPLHTVISLKISVGILIQGSGLS